MVRSFSLALLLVIFLGCPAFASDPQEGSFGLGVLVGEPTGVSYKRWFATTVAIDAAAGWSFHKQDSFAFYADLLFHDFTLFRLDSGRLPLYYGFGARIKTGEDDRVGIRFPVGVSYLFEKEPLDIFIEVAPVLDLNIGVALNFNVGVGARYWFGGKTTTQNQHISPQT